MREYKLDFISDNNLFNHVKETAEKYRFCVSLDAFRKNLLDPIKLTFDAKIYGKDIKDIIENEILRQIDKSNTNHIGYFHQNIFKYINKDWEIPAQGFDIVNRSSRIYVEMKNKHNTMNSSSSQKTYMRMLYTIQQDPRATCLLVEVIAKHSQDIVWTTSLDGQTVKTNKIRRVSIDKFYEKVTGDKNAFRKLCEVLPCVIEDVVQSSSEILVKHTVFQELEAISPNILKSIYLISFKEYEGFGDFDI